jgi:signal transduction histidine kinase
MKELLESIITTMQFEIDELKATVILKDVPRCIGDANQVNQVFSNLLNNALKYLAPERTGSVCISGHVENGRAVYCVEDNGVGIAREHHEKIFEIFHRLNPQTSHEGEGLGLTIITRILDRLDGRIWVESEPDKGSKFFVSLPEA